MNGTKIRIRTILRSLEQYTKTDMVYLARGGFWSLSSQGVGTTASFAVVVLLANLLPKDLFGQYRFILSTISILTVFTLPGIGTAITRSIAQKQIINLSQIVRVKIIWGTLGSIAAVGMALYYLYHGNIALVSPLILCALLLPFIEPYYVYWAYFKGKEDFKTPAIYEAISRIFQAVVLIFVVLLSKNILFIIGAYLVGQILARYFFYRRTLLKEKLLITTDLTLNNNNDTIKYGKYLSITQGIGTITANIDKLLVWHFLGAEMLASYYIALTIPANIILLCNIIPRVAFPKLAQNTWEPRERGRILRKLFIFLYALIIPAVIYFLLAPIAFPLIFKDYTITIATSSVLVFLILLSPLNAMIGQMLLAMRSVSKMIFLQVLATVVFATSFLILYKIFGGSVTIAVTALVTSEAMSLLMGIIFVKLTK